MVSSSSLGDGRNVSELVYRHTSSYGGRLREVLGRHSADPRPQVFSAVNRFETIDNSNLSDCGERPHKLIIAEPWPCQGYYHVDDSDTELFGPAHRSAESAGRWSRWLGKKLPATLSRDLATLSRFLRSMKAPG